MSLNRLALRLATVLALRGRTSAGERVWDSRIGEIDELARMDRSPFILVYVDDEDAQGDGQAVRKGERTVTLSIEIAIGTAKRDQAGGLSLLMPETDAQLELALDVIETEVMDALQVIESDARDLWATLVLDVPAMSVRRGAWGEEDKSTRYAARLIEMRVKIPRDPLPSGQPTQIITRLVALLRQYPDMVDIAAGIDALAARETGMTRQGLVAALIGASKAAAEAMQIDPSLADDHTFAGDSAPPDAQPSFPPREWI